MAVLDNGAGQRSLGVERTYSSWRRWSRLIPSTSRARCRVQCRQQKADCEWLYSAFRLTAHRPNLIGNKQHMDAPAAAGQSVRGSKSLGTTVGNPKIAFQPCCHNAHPKAAVVDGISWYTSRCVML